MAETVSKKELSKKNSMIKEALITSASVVLSVNDHSGTRVLVTGASGFIACHIIQLLLKKGYLVRGTVRNLNNKSKILPLQGLCPELQKRLELIEADLNDATVWIKAMENCTFVIHTATPMPNAEPDANKLIKTADGGTLNILQAAEQSSFVRRVVLTSCDSAILGEGIKGTKGYNEAHWTKLGDDVSAYARAKMMAERRAWEFIEEHATLELVVLNPGFVIGPLLHDSECMSSRVTTSMLTGSMTFIPELWHMIADVRDVAEAHFKAMTIPEAHGMRFAIGSRMLSYMEIAQILKNEFDPLGYRISTIPAPFWLLRVISIFDDHTKDMLKEIGRKYKTDTSRMKNILRINPIDPRKSIIDMAYSLIEKGMVPKTSKYKPQNQEEVK